MSDKERICSQLEALVRGQIWTAKAMPAPAVTPAPAVMPARQVAAPAARSQPVPATPTAQSLPASSMLRELPEGKILVLLDKSVEGRHKEVLAIQMKRWFGAIEFDDDSYVIAGAAGDFNRAALESLIASSKARGVFCFGANWAMELLDDDPAPWKNPAARSFGGVPIAFAPAPSLIIMHRSAKVDLWSELKIFAKGLT